MKKLIFDLQLFAVNQVNQTINTTGTSPTGSGYNDATDASHNVAYTNATSYEQWGRAQDGSKLASLGAGLTPEMKTFYDKALIELVGPQLVHEQFGQKRPIPRNGGKSIEFRRFKTLDKALTPITEGVTPKGNKLSVDALQVSVEQYGDYIELTDVLEMTAIDNVIVEATKKLADQAGRTMDTIVRDAINQGTCVQYCPTLSGTTYTSVTTRQGLNGTALLRVKDVFAAAARLKKRNAPTIGGSYVAIIHPYVSYDLMQEAGDEWVDITKYTEPGNIMKGEIGKLGNVRFVESSEAKIFTPQLIGSGAFGSSSTAKVFTFANSGTANVDLEIGDKVFINGTGYTLTTKVQKGVSTSFTISETAPEGASLDAYDLKTPVFSVLVLGADAYGVTDIAGGGIEHIVKQKGYGNDPLNQRSSIGWKGIKTAAILVDEYMQRIECNATLADADEAN